MKSLCLGVFFGPDKGHVIQRYILLFGLNVSISTTWPFMRMIIKHMQLQWMPTFLKFRRVTIRGAQPSARLSEEIGLAEGSAGVSERAPRGLSEGSAGLCGVLRGYAGFSEGFRG